MSFISFFLSLSDTITGIIAASWPASRPRCHAQQHDTHLAASNTNLAKGQSFPAHTVLPTSTIVTTFAILPLNIVLEPVDLELLQVFSGSSPKYLQAIWLVCRMFRQLLDSNQYVWCLARANLDMDFALPAAAAVTEPSLASYIFDPAPCTVCGVLTNALLPFSFSLQIRLCSSVCATYLVCVGPDSIDQHKALL
ncbi:hypothetical protein B0H13DRAFT_2303269 [Mycena leptocephala]|nr:hypothetical protein B0H13DRAFT_2303269 [Mycena leptocephala]